MKDGYIFPAYLSRKKPHITGKVAVCTFAKLRKLIAKDHPQFLEKTEYINKQGNLVRRYRIGWHSCRRWFETRIWDKYKDKMMLRDVMRYRESRTVDVYVDPYETWKNEANIIEDTFGGLFEQITKVEKGQTKLINYL